MWRLWVFSALMVVSASNQGHSEDCSRTLIPATTDTKYNELQNLSLAWNLSEKSYKEAKTNAGGQATIYGIPMGADYEQFHKNIDEKAQSYNLKNFKQRSLAYATSALTEENVKIYRDCVASFGGLALVVKELGKNNYVISWKYMPFPDAKVLRGHLGRTSNVQPADVKQLRKEISVLKFGRASNDFPLAPVNPKNESTLNIVVGSTGTALLLPPLDVPSTLPPKTFHWKLTQTGDCTARDLDCLLSSGPAPDEPAPGKCNQATVTLASVCWSNGANHDYPPFPTCHGAADWCT
jgi:hypothetical protein